MSKLTIEEIAELPFHRGGPHDNFDCAYAVRRSEEHRLNSSH